MQSPVRFNRICGHLIHGKRAVVFSVLGCWGNVAAVGDTAEACSVFLNHRKECMCAGRLL